jgi:hypothetical protein
MQASKRGMHQRKRSRKRREKLNQRRWFGIL